MKCLISLKNLQRPVNQAKQISLSPSLRQAEAEAGFSLVEAVIAMVVFLIALLGVFITFTYAVNYNAGNNARAQALAVSQQEAELIRSAKFTPAITDESLEGGVKATKPVTSEDGNAFSVDITVDDNPEDDNVLVDPTSTIKEITLIVALESPTPGWQTSVPMTIVLRRVRSN